MSTAAGTPLRGWLRPRGAYVSNRVRTVLAYRVDVLVALVGPALQVVLFGALWRALYAGKTTVDGVALPVMTTYVSLAALHQLLGHGDAVDWLERRVRDGRIGADLARPVGLLTQQVCGQVANLLVRLPMIALMLPVTALASGLTAPAAGALPRYLLATALGALINSCLNLLVAVVCFWTTELGGMSFLYFVISSFLSGALVPLWFMPGWLHGIVERLPLQSVIFTPLSIYVGQSTGSAAWRAIGVQGLWLAVLAASVWLLWRRAVHRVEVQGG